MKENKVSGMIFAAGLGTRLFPLTSRKPKALVEIQGKTLLANAVETLTAAGISRIVVNVHHFGEQIIDFFNTHTFAAEILISDEREKLLDTGGGLKFAESLFGEADDIVLYNVDILSNIDLQKMISYHRQQQALATLAVRQRETSRYLLFDNGTALLCGWRNRQSGEEKIVRPAAQKRELAFSGVHVVNRRIFSLIPNCEKQSITNLYLDMAPSQKIIAFEHTDDQWCDVGKLEIVRQLNGEI